MAWPTDVATVAVLPTTIVDSTPQVTLHKNVHNRIHADLAAIEGVLSAGTIGAVLISGGGAPAAPAFSNSIRILGTGLVGVGLGVVDPTYPLDVGGSIATLYGTRFAHTLTSAGASAAIVAIAGALVTSGVTPSGLHVLTTVAPTALTALAIGLNITPTFTPPAGVVMTAAVASRFQLVTGADAGGGAAITTGRAMLISAPSLSLKPTTVHGISILNQGVAGVTTAIAINLAAQSGASANYAIASAAGNLHGFGTVVPKAAVHIGGVNTGWLIEDEVTSNPTTTDLTADAAIAMYTKADELVFAYNNGGVMTYIKMALNGGPGLTVVHDTTPP